MARFGADRAGEIVGRDGGDINWGTPFVCWGATQHGGSLGSATRVCRGGRFISCLGGVFFLFLLFFFSSLGFVFFVFFFLFGSWPELCVVWVFLRGGRRRHTGAA